MFGSDTEELMKLRNLYTIVKGYTQEKGYSIEDVEAAVIVLDTIYRQQKAGKNVN